MATCDGEVKFTFEICRYDEQIRSKHETLEGIKNNQKKVEECLTMELGSIYNEMDILNSGKTGLRKSLSNFKELLFFGPSVNVINQR